MDSRDAEFLAELFPDVMKYKPIYFAVMTDGQWHLISEGIFDIFCRDPWPEKIRELIFRQVPAAEWDNIAGAAYELAKAEGISGVQALNEIAKEYDYKSKFFSSFTAKDWHELGVRFKKANCNIRAEEAFAKAKEMGYNG